MSCAQAGEGNTTSDYSGKLKHSLRPPRFLLSRFRRKVASMRAHVVARVVGLQIDSPE